jgi:hypothetical protein
MVRGDESETPKNVTRQNGSDTEANRTLNSGSVKHERLWNSLTAMFCVERYVYIQARRPKVRRWQQFHQVKPPGNNPSRGHERQPNASECPLLSNVFVHIRIFLISFRCLFGTGCSELIGRD